MVTFAISERIMPNPLGGDDGIDLIMKTSLLRRSNRGNIKAGFHSYFLGDIDEGSHGIVLTDQKDRENMPSMIRHVGSLNDFTKRSRPENNPNVRKILRYMDAYRQKYRSIMSQLPPEIVNELLKCWSQAAEILTEYPVWANILDKSRAEAIKKMKKAVQEELKENLYEIDKMERHYHDREILAVWREQAHCADTAAYKENRKKLVHTKMNEVQKKWAQLLQRVMAKLAALEDKFFPKTGRIYIPKEFDRKTHQKNSKSQTHLPQKKLAI